MRIANPIYDAVFKYLLEDIEIAKGIIGRIIGEEITELYFRPEELKTKSEKYLVIILRIDFKAVIKTKNGTYKKILIEIQKGKDDEDIVRFRKYLSENYQGKDNIKTDKGEEEKVLPIVPIYFLGFPLQKIDAAALKVGRNYIDLIGDKKITVKNHFIERLTHDGYFIQIGKLRKVDTKAKNSLERVLRVFNQSYRLTNDRRLLEISEKELDTDPLLKKVIERLHRAAADTEILKKIDVEEQVEERIEKQLRKVAELQEKMDIKDKVLEEKDKVLERLNNEKISAAKSLIVSTTLSDEQISSIQKMDIKTVQNIRQELKK